MDPSAWTLLDLILASLLVALGWAALASPDLKRGVTLFIGFGLLLALAWARLRAPDLALAEAAIGAGLSGAMLLAALRDEAQPGVASAPSPVDRLLGALVLALALVFGWALLDALIGPEAPSLADEVASHLEGSGVSNPVTAVLLNFRAYDTLLELAVLLAAALGILALGPARPGFEPSNLVLESLIRWVVPLVVVTGGYLLWVGAHAPGGAFQAAALLAAAGVLLRLGGRVDGGLPKPRMLRGLLVAGVAVFLGTGILLTLVGPGFLHYPAGWAGQLILLIETAATLSIAAALVLAYQGGRPAGWERSERTVNQSGSEDSRTC